MSIEAEPIGGGAPYRKAAGRFGPQSGTVPWYSRRAHRKRSTTGPAMAAHSDDPSNQAPPSADVDLFGTDGPLQGAMAANGAHAEAAALTAFGRHWGAAEKFEQARLANDTPPVLRGDVVEFHAAYHGFMAES